MDNLTPGKFYSVWGIHNKWRKEPAYHNAMYVRAEEIKGRKWHIFIVPPEQKEFELFGDPIATRVKVSENLLDVRGTNVIPRERGAVRLTRNNSERRTLFPQTAETLEIAGKLALSSTEERGKRMRDVLTKSELIPCPPIAEV